MLATSHLYKIDPFLFLINYSHASRDCLIWCFIKGHDFDVAKVIHDEMFIRCPVKRDGFFFPSLVTQLCRAANVPEYQPADGLVEKDSKIRADKVTTRRSRM